MEKKWYVVHTYSGYEHKAKAALEERVKSLGRAEEFGEVLVPAEKVVELVKGRKKTSSRKFFPGYILVNMVLNDDTWHVVKATPKVTGFIGNQRPQEVRPQEIEDQRRRTVEGAVKPKPRVNFDVGDEIRVIDGAFANFSGTVEEVKPDKQKLKVKVSIFGRATPVELDFSQVEKRA